MLRRLRLRHFLAVLRLAPCRRVGRRRSLDAELSAVAAAAPVGHLAGVAERVRECLCRADVTPNEYVRALLDLLLLVALVDPAAAVVVTRHSIAGRLHSDVAAIGMGELEVDLDPRLACHLGAEVPRRIARPFPGPVAFHFGRVRRWISVRAADRGHQHEHAHGAHAHAQNVSPRVAGRNPTHASVSDNGECWRLRPFWGLDEA